MSKKKPTLLILAAGMASRYGSLKQIDQIGPSGERIIDYSVYDAVNAGFGKIIFVIRKNFEDEFKEVILDKFPNDFETGYVFQELDAGHENFNSGIIRKKPWGTGHALLSAAEAIDSSFVVINADDFYGKTSYRIACEFCLYAEKTETNYALIGYKLGRTLSDYGSVSRGICSFDDKNKLSSVVERTEIKRNEDGIVFKCANSKWCSLNGSEIVSMNMFAFTPRIFSSLQNLFSKFIRENSDAPDSEFFLPSALDILIRNNNANVKVLNTNEQWFGLTYREDKNKVKEKILELVNAGKYPKKLW